MPQTCEYVQANVQYAVCEGRGSVFESVRGWSRLFLDLIASAAWPRCSELWPKVHYDMYRRALTTTTGVRRDGRYNNSEVEEGTGTN